MGRRLLTSLVMMLLSVISAHAASISVTLEHPTQNEDESSLTDLAGCRLFYGSASGVYDTEIDIGLATSAVISGLVTGQTYYVVGTAYDHAANESVFSNEVAKVTQAEEPGDTTPPTVAIISPLDGSTVVRKSTVTVQAEATDNVAVRQVELYVNGTLLCTDTLGPAYTCTWKVPAARGKRYVLEAIAEDTAGHESLSPPVVVTSP